MLGTVILLVTAQPAASSNSSGQNLTPLLLGFAGGLLASLLSLVGVHLANRNQLTRDRDNDLRKLRDERRERLRSDYTAVLNAVWAMQAVTHYRKFLLDSETVEERDHRLNRELAEAVNGLNLVRARLRLESDGRAILDALNKVQHAMQKIDQDRIVNIEQPATVRQEQRDAAWKALNDGVRHLNDTAQEHLRRLEEPIGGPRPWWWRRRLSRIH